MSRCVHRKTLNVGDGASFEEIRKAFRKLALVYHPDKSDILDAEEKFKKINTAYDYLKKRHDINSSDDFNTKNESFLSKKEPKRLEIKATFQDILRGSHVKVAGISGSVEIKPGSTEGTEYLVNSTGKIVKDSKLADYVLVLRITPHPHFERQFNDLIYQAEITSQDSKRGITLKIPTLDGNDLDLRVQNVDSLDSRCIPGRGFPLYHNPKFCGDLIVKFKIKTSIMKRSLPLTLEELFRGCAKFEEIPFQTVFKYGTKSSEVHSIGIVCLPGLVPGTVIKKDILPFDSSYLSIDPSCVEFTIEEIPHQLFTREKNDLKCTVSISTDDSEVRVPTIEGGHVTVKIPDVVTRTSVRRVVGYGMPCSTNSNIRGDLLVSFDFKSIKQQPSMNSSSDFDSKHLQTHYDLPLTLHEILFGCTKTMKVAVRVLDSKGKPKNEERDVNVRCKPGLSENFKINHCLYRPYENISPRNVYFIVKILPHQHFKVQNNDIVYVASISFWDTKVEVPTIKGDKMTVNVPKAVNENSTSRLLGRGLPFTVNSVNRRGDLIVKFNVEKVQVVEKDLFVSLEDLLKGCIKYRTFTSKTGRRREEAIVVKPGMKEGTRVRFSTKEQSNEVFIVKVKPHKLFTRSGSDLIYQASVSHRGATTSTLLEIPLLDGKDFLLRVTRIDSEQTREIPNQGLPLSINSSERGKMVVKFSICPPEHAVIVRELYITLEENLRGCTRTELIDTVDIEDGVESNNVQQFKVYLEPGVNHRTIIADSFYENYFHRTVHFVVNISPHKTFQRQGKKLVYSTKIKPQDKQIRVPTLQGGDIMFNIPKYSKDFVKVFKSRGLPFSDSSRYGDLVLYWSY